MRKVIKPKTIVGVMKEITPQEGRIAITPEYVTKLTKLGHQVLVGKGAGELSGFADKQFQEAGGSLVPNSHNIWQKSDVILQINKPVKHQVTFFKQQEKQLAGKTMLAFFNFANQQSKSLLQVLAKSHLNVVSLELMREQVSSHRYHYPILHPMSAIAGTMAIQLGTFYLGSNEGGRGILPGSILGIKERDPGQIVIIGGGTVGQAAAKRALDVGIQVVILEKDAQTRKQLKADTGLMPAKILSSSPKMLDKYLVKADIVVGAVQTNGARAPILISQEQVTTMKSGAVIIDVSVDQGGIIEGIRPTTHNKPTIITKTGQLIYGVANIPGRVPRTASQILADALLPYLLTLVKDPENSCITDDTLRSGLVCSHGHITHKEIADTHGLTWVNPTKLEMTTK